MTANSYSPSDLSEILGSKARAAGEWGRGMPCSHFFKLPMWDWQHAQARHLVLPPKIQPIR